MLFQYTFLAAATLGCFAVPTLSKKVVEPSLKHAFSAHILVGKPVGPIPADGQLTIGKSVLIQYLNLID